MPLARDGNEFTLWGAARWSIAAVCQGSTIARHANGWVLLTGIRIISEGSIR